MSDILSRLRTGLPLPASKAMELHALSRHCWSHNDKFSKRRQKNNSLYTREPYYCIEISTFSFPLPNPRLHSKGLAMEKRLRHRRIYTPRTILFACEILLPRFSLYYCFKLCEIKFINFSRSSQMSLLLSWLCSSFLMLELWQNYTFVYFFASRSAPFSFFLARV